jgi:hypothetical protein
VNQFTQPTAPMMTTEADAVRDEFFDLIDEKGYRKAIDTMKARYPDAPDIAFLAVGYSLWNQPGPSLPPTMEASAILNEPKFRQAAKEYPELAFFLIPNEFRDGTYSFEEARNQLDEALRTTNPGVVLEPGGTVGGRAGEYLQQQGWDQFFAIESTFKAKLKAAGVGPDQASSYAAIKARWYDKPIDQLQMTNLTWARDFATHEEPFLDEALNKLRTVSTLPIWEDTEMGKALRDYFAAADPIRKAMHDNNITALDTASAEELGLDEQYKALVADMEKRYPNTWPYLDHFWLGDDFKNVATHREDVYRRLGADENWVADVLAPWEKKWDQAGNAITNANTQTEESAAFIELNRLSLQAQRLTRGGKEVTAHKPPVAIYVQGAHPRLQGATERAVELWNQAAGFSVLKLVPDKTEGAVPIRLANEINDWYAGNFALDEEAEFTEGQVRGTKPALLDEVNLTLAHELGHALGFQHPVVGSTAEKYIPTNFKRYDPKDPSTWRVAGVGIMGNEMHKKDPDFRGLGPSPGEIAYLQQQFEEKKVLKGGLNPQDVWWQTQTRHEQADTTLRVAQKPYVFLTTFERQEILGIKTTPVVEKTFIRIAEAKVEVNKAIDNGMDTSTAWGHFDEWVKKEVLPVPGMRKAIKQAHGFGFALFRNIPKEWQGGVEGDAWKAIQEGANAIHQAFINKEFVDDETFRRVKVAFGQYIDEWKEYSPDFKDHVNELRDLSGDQLVEVLLPELWWTLI